ncbi:protein KINESIN LIGHT CHAIN-RELATED 3-like [Olea europaea var. sylvestris]|uniref:KINESIN LIGHT CHAIN-RELATED 3-like n=1 Tax=Olea europaea subsp. europaea TaxID=158383 RepID=A0A8S0PPC7_OLEEU|nr:protein KINESIN LIGHT CHAIN-RELATED 3-like [Olea europaea var. sylvestris]CAA2956086.1 KINESIN LIGHT CHAIN-RELATED 3-like [Olea europaea subsp. europaea]
MDGIHEVNENGTAAHHEENPAENNSANGGLTSECPPNGDVGHPSHPIDGVEETSIEQLYENVCEMRSSDQSPSRPSFGSDGEESRIDSELRHLVGGEMVEVEIIEEDEAVHKPENGDHHSDSGSKKESLSAGKLDNSISASASTSTPSAQSRKASHLQVESEVSAKSSPKIRNPEKPPRSENSAGKIKKNKNSVFGSLKLQNGIEDPSEAGSDNPDLGPFLLKQARDLMSSGDNPRRALGLALRAAKSFEKCADGKPSLDVVMCLHVIAAIHCTLGQYSEAIPILEHSIEIPTIEEGDNHALAKFAGYMQLGDTYAMLGQLENSISSYTTGLEVQKQILGELDPRVGETCRYLAEAHIQAMQFDEAQKLCHMALDIHRENGSPASLEEAADRRLMGMICESKGDHETALEHLVLASMAMVANGQESEVASVDCSIGDTYLSLNRYDEAIFAYQKALTSLKAGKGENHPAVASVFVRLADLYNKTGKLRDSRSYCENALRIYEKPIPGIAPEEIASGLTDISAIYESMNELDHALKLLKKALKIYSDAPGQQNTVAGIEAQMGVMYYMLGNYSESYSSFKSATTKLRASGEKKSAFFGIALNQMGLACVQRYAINEAVQLFEEARGILEQEYGPYHPDTLGVYSNLAGTYDAIGRLDDAIEILELIVGMREEKLGTANPDVEDEKKRLAELLKESGRARNRKNRSLETLLDSNPNTNTINNGAIRV